MARWGETALNVNTSLLRLPGCLYSLFNHWSYAPVDHQLGSKNWMFLHFDIPRRGVGYSILRQIWKWNAFRGGEKVANLFTWLRKWKAFWLHSHANSFNILTSIADLHPAEKGEFRTFSEKVALWEKKKLGGGGGGSPENILKGRIYLSKQVNKCNLSSPIDKINICKHGKPLRIKIYLGCFLNKFPISAPIS